VLLAIDIGNTHISLGLFSREHLVKRYSIPTDSKSYIGPLKEDISQA